MWQKRGVAILINRTDFPQKKIIQDKKGRCVMAVGSIGETELYILNLNAQNEDDYGLFKEIANVVASIAKGMIIVGGDFNTVQDGIRDRLPSEKTPLSKKSKILNSMITELGLVDTWRGYIPKGKDSSLFSNDHGSYS